MSVYRSEHTRDFTIMANNHLKNKNLSLKAKGLLSLMLSLPDDWIFNIRGLSCICKDGKSSISSALKELESYGYLKREWKRDKDGQMAEMEYKIREVPFFTSPLTENQSADNQSTDNLITEKQFTEKRTLLSTKELNTKELNTYPLIPHQSVKVADDDEKNDYRKIICKNISYDSVIRENMARKKQIDEIVDIMLDAVCSRREYFVISGQEYSHKCVKDKMLMLDEDDITGAVLILNENKVHIKNARAYILSLLFNSSEFSSYKMKKNKYDIDDWESL